MSVAEKAQRKLDSLLLKKDHPGAACSSLSGVPCARKYRGQRNATQIRLERGSKEWFLVSVSSTTLWPDQGGYTRVLLSSEQDAIAIEKFRSENYRIL